MACPSIPGKIKRVNKTPNGHDEIFDNYVDSEFGLLMQQAWPRHGEPYALPGLRRGKTALVHRSEDINEVNILTEEFPR
jgi:hypothetical protein